MPKLSLIFILLFLNALIFILLFLHALRGWSTNNHDHKSTLVLNLISKRKSRQARPKAKNKATTCEQSGCNNLQFIHIPKTGGTAVANKINAKLRYSSKLHENCSSYHVPPTWHKSWTENKTYFTLFRNPYHRMISQFRFSCWAVREGMQKMLDPMPMGTVGECQKNKTMLNAYLRAALIDLKLYQKKIARKDAFNMDCHFVRQVEYKENAQVFCSMCELAEWLESKGLNVSKLHELPSYHVDDYLDKDVQEMIASVYRDDFIECNFTMNPAESY